MTETPTPKDNAAVLAKVLKSMSDDDLQDSIYNHHCKLMQLEFINDSWVFTQLIALRAERSRRTKLDEEVSV